MVSTSMRTFDSLKKLQMELASESKKAVLQKTTLDWPSVGIYDTLHYRHKVMPLSHCLLSRILNLELIEIQDILPEARFTVVDKDS